MPARTVAWSMVAACELLVDAGADAGARIDVGLTASDLADRFPELQGWLLDRQTR